MGLTYYGRRSLLSAAARGFLSSAKFPRRSLRGNAAAACAPSATERSSIGERKLNPRRPDNNGRRDQARWNGTGKIVPPGKAIRFPAVYDRLRLERYLFAKMRAWLSTGLFAGLHTVTAYALVRFRCS